MHGNVPEGLEPGLDEEIHLRSGGLNFPFGMHLAVVEIDRESGAPRLDRMWAVDDAGNIVNPMLAEGQRHGGLAQGIGQAIWEEVLYDEDGNLVTSSFMDYLMPTAATLPSFGLDATVTTTPTNPLGAKGIGEAGAIGSTPAVLNAVSDALDGAEVQVPVKPEQIWRILNAS
jgi:carbon-monoxide dehydrogenase large subunit